MLAENTASVMAQSGIFAIVKRHWNAIDCERNNYAKNGTILRQGYPAFFAAYRILQS